MFFKIGVLKNFVIFTGKYLCWSFLLIKLTPKTPKRLQYRCFLVNIERFLRTPFLRNTSGGCFCCFTKFVIRTFVHGFELVTHRFEFVTREFELVTRGFELVTRGFKLVTREVELVTRGFELVTRGFELVTRGFQLVTREFEFVTRGFELALLNFNSCF